MGVCVCVCVCVCVGVCKGAHVMYCTCMAHYNTNSVTMD